MDVPAYHYRCYIWLYDSAWTWIGLNALDTPGRFVWHDGTTPTYSGGWHYGEPDNSGSCVQMYAYYGFDWTDTKCDRWAPYAMCEKDWIIMFCHFMEGNISNGVINCLFPQRFWSFAYKSDTFLFEKRGQDNFEY